MKRQVLAAVALVCVSTAVIQAEFVIETVPVNNPGNTDDTHGDGHGTVRDGLSSNRLLFTLLSSLLRADSVLSVDFGFLPRGDSTLPVNIGFAT